MAGIPSGAPSVTGTDAEAPLPPITIGPDGKPVIPKGYNVIKAQEGDYLCSFAANHGFKDCQFLRQTNPHLASKAVLDAGDPVAIPRKRIKQEATAEKTLLKAKRPLFRAASVRFVGLGTRLNERGSRGLTTLGLSNYITDKAGSNGNGTTTPFFLAKGADDTSTMTAPEKETFADPDHFRVEVHDPTAGKQKLADVTVQLQVLQPLYKRQAVKAKTLIVRDKQSRPNATAPNDAPAGFKLPTSADRKLSVKCFRVGDTSFYRSRYLRLVTHEKDKLADHTLFVGDYYVEGATDDEKRYTEILEQRVRARYQPRMCQTSATKCLAESYANVGRLDKEIRLSVHVMDNCCSNEDVRRVIYRQVRRAYAQAGTRPHIKAIFRHPPPKNVLTIGATAGTGLIASGETNVAGPGGKKTRSKLTVKVDGKTVVHNLSKNETLPTVAGNLVELLKKEGFVCRILVRAPTPPPNGKTEQPSRDVLIFKDEAHTQFAEIASVTSDDTQLSASFNPLDSAKLGSLTHDDEQGDHNILKACCDTEWFDAIVIKSFDRSGGSILFGIATWLHLPFGPAIIVESARMTPNPDDERYTFSHELGHVLVNSGHCVTANEKEQLMVIGGQAVGNAFDLPGRRRIMDAPLQVKYQVLLPGGKFVGLLTLEAASLHGTAAGRVLRFVTGEPAGSPTDREATAEW